MSTIAELRQFGVESLEGTVSDISRDVDFLLMHILRLEKIDLIIKSSDQVDAEYETQFKEAIIRLKNHEPLQYITGKQDFMGLTFNVRPGVLIPRQDTELLIETLIDQYKGRKINVLELGLGSGAIALSLGYFLPGSHLVGVDIDDVPVAVTAENSKVLKVPIDILKGDLFTPVDESLKGSFDLVVSNPPYISEEEMLTLEKNVSEHEPHLALCGGVKGHEFYERIIPEALDFLKEKGTLAFEIGYNQGVVVKDLMEQHGYRGVRVLKDLAGHDRVVLGYKE